MKVYIVRYFSDHQSGVKAYSSIKAMQKDIAAQKKFDDTLWAIDHDITEVHPTKAGIIEWFNQQAWHDQ